MRRVAIALAALALAVVTTGEAQSFGKRLKDRAKRAAEQAAEDRAARRAGQAAEKVLDGAEGAATGAAATVAAPDTEPTAPAQEAAEPAEAPAASAPAAPADLRAGAFVNYDFVPGARVLFAEDFTRDNIGDFPRRLEFHDGALEIVEAGGTRWLQSTAEGEFYVKLPEVLPARFTLEFDLVSQSNYNGNIYLSGGRPEDGADWDLYGARRAGSVLMLDRYAVSMEGGTGGKFARRFAQQLDGTRITIRLMADGPYIKVYADGRRIANVPNGSFVRSEWLTFVVTGHENDPLLLGNLRIAAGGKDLYDAIAESGRVATQGILFDSGSDRIRPESAPTLEQIAAMLTTHATLRLRIEGHTDDVGQAPANLALSERRARAVRQALIDHHRIAADRLEAVGLGQTKPAVPNTSPEGRQQNRRVELVRL